MAASISASPFKAGCLALMDQVAATGEVPVITKNGQPVVEPHPGAPSLCSPRRSTPFGLHPAVEIHGEGFTPIESPWSVLK